jgi:hypothetical protein
MCTLMEKDVLLDTISATTAFIAYRTPRGPTYTVTEDLKECSHLRYKILSSDPEQIDKQKVYEKLDALKAKYEGLPAYPYYVDNSDS